MYIIYIYIYPHTCYGMKYRCPFLCTFFIISCQRTKWAHKAKSHVDNAKVEEMSMAQKDRGFLFAEESQCGVHEVGTDFLKNMPNGGFWFCGPMSKSKCAQCAGETKTQQCTAVRETRKDVIAPSRFEVSNIF